MDTVTQINSNIYPNAIAALKVSMEDMNIVVASDNQMKESRHVMAKKRNGKKSEDGIKDPEVEAIWKNLGLGKIDISYACIGYTHDGRMVLLQDELISLLINYGFTIQPIMMFIDDFAENTREDDSAPIIMYSANTAQIMTEVEPLASAIKDSQQDGK